MMDCIAKSLRTTIHYFVPHFMYILSTYHNKVLFASAFDNVYVNHSSFQHYILPLQSSYGLPIQCYMAINYNRT